MTRGNPISLLCIVGLVLAMQGCASGPQLPIATPVLNIAITYNAAPDGGTITDCDVMIDRSGAEASQRTTGNATDAVVSPTTRVGVTP